MQDKTGSSNKLLSLQFLRCVAVILVIHAHAIDSQMSINIGDSFQQNFYFLKDFGAIGVDIFFVLSGFIISLGAKKYLRLHGFRDFLVKRLIRILPIYWIATLITIAFSIFTANTSSLTSVNSPSRYFLKSFILLPLFDGEYFRDTILVQAWTLSFELFFYIVIATFILSKSKYIVVISLSFITLLVVAGTIMSPSNVMFKFVSNPINLEFVFGCIIGIIYSSKARISYIFSVGLISLALTMLASTLIMGYGDIASHESIVNGNLPLTRLLMWGIPCSLLVASLVFLEPYFIKYIPSILILTGDASYSIYLTQYLSLRIFTEVWKGFNLGQPDIFIVASIVFSLFIGIIFYFLIEKRLVNYLNRQYSFLVK